MTKKWYFMSFVGLTLLSGVMQSAYDLYNEESGYQSEEEDPEVRALLASTRQEYEEKQREDYKRAQRAGGRAEEEEEEEKESEATVHPRQQTLYGEMGQRVLADIQDKLTQAAGMAYFPVFNKNMLNRYQTHILNGSYQAQDLSKISKTVNDLFEAGIEVQHKEVLERKNPPKEEELPSYFDTAGF